MKATSQSPRALLLRPRRATGSGRRRHPRRRPIRTARLTRSSRARWRWRRPHARHPRPTSNDPLAALGRVADLRAFSDLWSRSVPALLVPGLFSVLSLAAFRFPFAFSDRAALASAAIRSRSACSSSGISSSAASASSLSPRCTAPRFVPEAAAFLSAVRVFFFGVDSTEPVVPLLVAPLASVPSALRGRSFASRGGKST